MFKNYFYVALRNLWKNKGFSAINIFGLAIGLATCLLIMIYVTDELSYDRYNVNASRIYRMNTDIHYGGELHNFATTPAPLAATMKQAFPDVEEVTRFRVYGGLQVRKGADDINEEHVVYADSTLFRVFTLPLIAGDPATALQLPRHVVLTETTARKYFNSTDVVGRTLLVNDSVSFTVSGVMKDVPMQSHFRFTFFVSMAGVPESRNDQWLSNNFQTYVLFKPGTDPAKVQQRFSGMVSKYCAPQLSALLGTTLEDFEKGGDYFRFSMTPLTDIHLYSNRSLELSANSSIQYVWIFSAIALFILLIACVNFMNLSTARSSNRAKEVGIRKVMGSQRGQLITQFIAESVMITFIAMLLAIGIASIALPFFNHLSGKELSAAIFLKPLLIAGLLGVVILTGLLAGSYPAFFLSAFQPVSVLKGAANKGFRAGILRNVLVVFQFGISVFLIVGTLVIYNQLNFIRNKKIGFDRDQVIVLHHTSSLGGQADAFRQEVLSLPGVAGGTVTDYLPTGGNTNSEPIFLEPSLDQKKSVVMQTWSVDDQYIPVMSMQLAKGRNFSKDFPTDSSGVIINEAAARLLGLNDPLNRDLYELNNMHSRESTRFHIVGVVKDFNFSSLRDQVQPLALFLRPSDGNVAFRFHTKDIPALVAKVEAKWRAMMPGKPFNYSFMDDDFNAQYKSEVRVGRISVIFSVLAVLIACLGLFGLAAYAAEQRTREIGIRKVLGATTTNIVDLLSRDFLKLVLVAILLASPIAWWAMHRWLQDFAYRITIGWSVFALAAVLAVLIALLTVSFQAIKAAVANPVKSLRSQ
ncbi:ABC transporter permease [Chitinophaga vietnamensis]|uniref:ABC transporter permease n=1 Tax=Chitinophaga vietnamensis TaxID=2593957 RepID=UPI0011780048|nr:ABC transporter permease [Chitinophaga vietnamensis]